MTDQLDSNLTRLFAEAEQDLTDPNFTKDVMVKMRKTAVAQKAGMWGGILAALTIVWIFSKSLQLMGQLIIQTLSHPIVTINNQDLAWIFLPVNNLACLLLLVGMAFILLQRNIRSIAMGQ